MAEHVVLGGCGFIGRHVVRLLLERGDSVTVLDPSPWPGPEAGSRPVIAAGSPDSLTDIQLDAIVSRADVVHHYAWSTIPQSANVDPRADLTSNVGLTIRLLESSRRAGGRRIVFASSGGTIYGRLREVPVTEDHPIAPMTAYGVSKATAEAYLRYYRDAFGIDCRIARISNPYGAGQNPLRPQGVLSTIVYRALAGQPIEIWGDGTVVRDFVHVCDVAEALVRMATIDAIGSESTMNVGLGVGYSVNQMVSAVESALGRPIAVQRLQGRAFDVPVSVLDIDRATAVLGWRPRVLVDAGITLMLRDLTANPGRSFSSPLTCSS